MVLDAHWDGWCHSAVESLRVALVDQLRDFEQEQCKTFKGQLETFRTAFQSSLTLHEDQFVKPLCEENCQLRNKRGSIRERRADASAYDVMPQSRSAASTYLCVRGPSQADGADGKTNGEIDAPTPVEQGAIRLSITEVGELVQVAPDEGSLGDNEEQERAEQSWRALFPGVEDEVRLERTNDEISASLRTLALDRRSLSFAEETAFGEETSQEYEKHMSDLGEFFGDAASMRSLSDPEQPQYMSRVERLQMALARAKRHTCTSADHRKSSVYTRASFTNSFNLGRPSVASATGLNIPDSLDTFFLRTEWVHLLSCVLERASETSIHSEQSEDLLYWDPAGQWTDGQSRFSLRKLVSKCIISPFCKKRLWWDMVAMLVTLYDLIMIPMAFFRIEDSDFTHGMFWFTLFFWSLDIILSFFTGVQVESGIEMRLEVIANLYIRGWLPVDLLIILPEWIVLCMGSAGSGESGSLTRLGKIAKVMRFVRSVRLLRVFRFSRALSGVQDRLKSEFMMNMLDFGKLVGAVAMLNHYLSCFWYGIGTMEAEDGWVHQFKHQSSPTEYQYLTSLHWSISQFHGAMEVFPGTSSERSYAIGTAFLGLILASLFISSITNLIMRMQKLHQETFLNTRKMLRYLNENHVSPDLTVRIKRFARRTTNATFMRVKDVELLKTLPSHLLEELNVETKSPNLQMNMLLKHIVGKVPHAKKQLCLEVLSEAHVRSGGLVFGNLEKSNQMFLVSKGKVMYQPHAPIPKSSLPKPRGTGSEEALVSATNTSSESVGQTNTGSDRGSFSNSFKSFQMVRNTKAKLHKAIDSSHKLKRIITRASTAVPDDAEEVAVQAGNSLAEMNLWTSWQHQGDCMVVGFASIYSVAADAFARVLTIEKNHSVELALDISQYATKYVVWLNTINSQEGIINDLSYPPDLEFVDRDRHHVGRIVSAETMRKVGQMSLKQGAKRFGRMFRAS